MSGKNWCCLVVQCNAQTNIHSTSKLSVLAVKMKKCREFIGTNYMYVHCCFLDLTLTEKLP